MISSGQCTRLAVIFLAVIFLSFSPAALAAESPFTVGVSILPQAFFVEKIAGPNIRILVMVPPGASPATYEPKPRQLAALSGCKIYFAQGLPFEAAWLPRFKRSNPKMRVVACYDMVKRVSINPDSSAAGHLGSHMGQSDPHIWLSPPLAIIEARNISKALVNEDPSRAGYYRENYRTLVHKIVDLDLKIMELFDGVGNHNCFLVYHPAWGYFARTYGLRQVAVEKGGKAPLAHDLKQLTTFAKKKGFSTLFIQPQISGHTARVIANSIGARLLPLDPLARQWDENLMEAAKKIRSALR